MGTLHAAVLSTLALSVSATTSGPGNLENHACSAGQDAAGNEVMDCASAMCPWAFQRQRRR
jgi:hypothetical protein